jgi:hypothetical protein
MDDLAYIWGSDHLDSRYSQLTQMRSQVRALFRPLQTASLLTCRGDAVFVAVLVKLEAASHAVI